MKTKIIIVGLILIALLLAGCTNPTSNGQDNNSTNNNNNDNNSILDTNSFNSGSFKAVDNSVCTINEKPVVRLFSTTWCSHCKWINDTYNKVVKEYVDANKIIAYHWELDTKDDSLTESIEGVIPESELAVYNQFNPKGSIPTFVFGCKYYRIGNGYEIGKRLDLEEAEFREIIEELIKQTTTEN